MGEILEGTSTKKVYDDLQAAASVVFFGGLLVAFGMVLGAAQLPPLYTTIGLVVAAVFAGLSYVVSIMLRGFAHGLELLAYIYEAQPDKKEEA